MNYLFWIGFMFSSSTLPALHSDDLEPATLGDSVTLPCAVSSGSLCSSVTWTNDNSPSPLVSSGEVKAPNVTLLRDCSLQISNIVSENATTYTCNNSKSASKVELRILNTSKLMNKTSGKTELHCFLNSYGGYVPCKKPELLISWFAEDNTVVKENPPRFHLDKISDCFLKLHIQLKPTDHRRKWRCQMSLNGTAKATASYTTLVDNGIEEVFAAVGESVSLTCTNTSSLSWTEGQTETSVTFTDSAAIIEKVDLLDAADYNCTNEGKVNMYRLHTFDITSELDPGGENMTLTCVLTCASSTCDKDFSLTWYKNNPMYTSFSNGTGSLFNKLSIPLIQLGHGEKVCSVLREGVQVAAKKWSHNNSPPGLVWIVISIGSLCLAAVGVICLYRKRKHNKDQENLQEHIGMTHVYEDVKDCGPQRKTDAVTSKDSFYDLLQAVN